jgi:hypothetical protein
MQFLTKVILLELITVFSIIATLLMKPQPQDPAYHNFADGVIWMGVNNFLNVISNLPFIIVGAIGLSYLRRSGTNRTIRIVYFVLFTGIILTGLGSAYYHFNPNNNSLVFDRIPMTIVFTAFLSAVVAECINERIGRQLLFPLVATGISSVFWWHYTELQGNGDLRFYGFIQFYPMLIIPVILLVFPSPLNVKAWRSLLWVVGWYVIAKVFERFDLEIYTLTGFLSGHSLKHFAAAVATWYMVEMFYKKYTITTDPNMRDYSKEPDFIKAGEKAAAFFKKHPLPKELTQPKKKDK